MQDFCRLSSPSISTVLPEFFPYIIFVWIKACWCLCRLGWFSLITFLSLSLSVCLCVHESFPTTSVLSASLLGLWIPTIFMSPSMSASCYMCFTSYYYLESTQRGRYGMIWETDGIGLCIHGSYDNTTSMIMLCYVWPWIMRCCCYCCCCGSNSMGSCYSRGGGWPEISCCLWMMVFNCLVLSCLGLSFLACPVLVVFRSVMFLLRCAMVSYCGSLLLVFELAFYSHVES